MGKYSIKDLEHYSNVKAHTIRIWEQRYDLLKPQRTPTKIRYYSDEDLRLILNVSFLKSHGMKISKIAELSHKEIENKVIELSDTNLEYSRHIDALIIAMVSFDEAYFDKILSTNIVQAGFESTIINVVYPFLRRIGTLWQTGSINPAQEHFISNLIRQKLILAVDGQFASQDQKSETFLLYLPEGELHELSLLFATYIIKTAGHRVMYLGQSLPMKDLETLPENSHPDWMLSIFTTYPGKPELDGYIDNILAKFPKTKFVFSGYQVKNYEYDHDRVVLLQDLRDLIPLLKRDDLKQGENIQDIYKKR